MRSVYLRRTLLTFVLLAVFASCQLFPSGDDDDDDDEGTTTNQVLPSKVMVTVPNSLVGTTPAASSRGSRATTGKAEEAYTTIKTGVAMMQENTVGVVMYGVILDEVIFQNKLSPSNETHSGLTMKITENLVTKMSAFAQASGMESEDMSGLIGQDMPVPDFTYTSASAPYSYSLNMSETDPEVGNTFTSFSWNAEKTKVRLLMADVDPAVGIPSYKYTITYDDTTKTSSMVMDEASFPTYTFSLREDEESDKHGVYVFYETKKDDWSYSGVGYADDDGGTLKLTLKIGTGITAQVMVEETSFNASTVDPTLAVNYQDDVADIDDSMYEDVDAASELSGESLDYSMETGVYTFNGVAEYADLTDTASSFYVLFDARITQSGTPIETGTSIDLTTQSASLDNVDTVGYVGNAYASAANELTVFLDGVAAETAYVYLIEYDSGTGANTMEYLGSLTL